MADTAVVGPLLRLCDRAGWWCIDLITPGLVNAQHRYAAELEAAVQGDSRWLDIGCGHRLLPRWLHAAEERQWALARRAQMAVGIDLDEGSLGKNRLLAGHLCKADVGALPFTEGSFDLVTANMVFEHVADPADALREIRRVLRPGGALVLMTPNAAHPFVWLVEWLPDWGKRLLARVLEGRAAADVFETHYRFNRTAEIQRLAEGAGLAVSAITPAETTPITHRLGPLAALELLLTRALRWPRLAAHRSVLIVRLERPTSAAMSGMAAA